MKRAVLAIPFLASAICCLPEGTVAQHIPQPQARTSGETTAPKGDSGWIPVAAAEWEALSESLIGKSVELSGRLETLPLVDPGSAIGNVGWMRNADRVEFARVVFDQIGPQEIGWMANNRCHQGCDGIFVRGVVVTIPYVRRPVLRMKEISFESQAGTAPLEMVSVTDGPGSSTSDGEKTLLPPGGVPTRDGTAGGALAIPTVAPAESRDQSTWGQLTARSDEVRLRDYNMDRGIIPGPERPDDFETYYRSIRDTKLNNVFAAFPWNLGYNPWPRVVLVVEEKPQLGNLLYKQPGDPIEDRCWRLSARLWTGPAAGEDIAAFNWCLGEMRYNVPYSDVAHWGRTPKISMLDKNTGPQPTLGPNPPYLPAPEYQYRDGAHFDTIMLGTLLVDMGFAFGVPDGRVWIVDKEMVRPEP